MTPPPPPPPPRGSSTRQLLVDAAWRLIDRMTTAELLAGLSARRVSARAGRTPGAFHHHFESHEEFVAAMLEDLTEQAHQRTPQILVHHRVSGAVEDLLDAVHSTSDGVLDQWEDGGDTFQRRLLLVNSRAVADDHARAALRAESEIRVERVATSVEWLLAALGREVMPPLTIRDVTRLAVATQETLMLRRAAEPDVVDGEYMARVWTAEIIAYTRPLGSTVTVDDVATSIRPKRRPDEGRASTTPEGGGVEAAIDLFRAGWQHRTFGEVAELLGRDADELATRFGTMRRLVASTFSASEPAVREAAARHRDRDARRALADAFCEIARWASAHPHVATALVEERIHPWHGAAAPDIHAVVPLDAIVLEALEHLATVEGLDAHDVDTVRELAGAATDLTLNVASTRPQMSPADVAMLAVRVAVPARDVVP